MKIYYVFMMIVFFLSCSEDKSDHEILSFELRLAETESNSKLPEMILHNSALKFFVDSTVFLDNKDITSAEVIDWETYPKIMVILNDEGRKKFATFTQENIGKNAAILVASKLVSAPKIMAQITEGKLLIVGNFTHEEALKIINGISP
jgi:preprotein translocase subunit SecD